MHYKSGSVRYQLVKQTKFKKIYPAIYPSLGMKKNTHNSPAVMSEQLNIILYSFHWSYIIIMNGEMVGTYMHEISGIFQRSYVIRNVCQENKTHSRGIWINFCFYLQCLFANWQKNNEDFSPEYNVGTCMLKVQCCYQLLILRMSRRNFVSGGSMVGEMKTTRDCWVYR